MAALWGTAGFVTVCVLTLMQTAIKLATLCFPPQRGDIGKCYEKL